MKPLSLDTDSPRWPAVVIQAAADASDELERMHNIAKRAKIMMVDDEELNLRAIEKTLRRYGYESFINITNACQAVPLIAAEQPDLLLLDIMMPVINGLDILRQLRSQPRFQCLPIIVLTAYCDPETRRHALQAGCTDFLPKPVDLQELGLKVRNILLAKACYDVLARRAEQLEHQVSQQAGELASAQREAQVRYLAGPARNNAQLRGVAQFAAVCYITRSRVTMPVIQR